MKKTLELPELETIISTERGERSFHIGHHLKKRTREANKGNGAARRSSTYEVYTDTPEGSFMRSRGSERLSTWRGAK